MKPHRASAYVATLVELNRYGNLERIPLESRFVGKFIEVLEADGHLALGSRDDGRQTERSRAAPGGSKRAKETLPGRDAEVVPVERIELPTFGLQNRCTTAVLHRRRTTQLAVDGERRAL